MMSHPEFAIVTYGPLEMEAAAALILLRYQFEDQEMAAVCSSNTVIRYAKKPQPEEAMPSTSSQPRKKRSILNHLQSIPDAAKIYCMDPAQLQLIYDFLENEMI